MNFEQPQRQSTKGILIFAGRFTYNFLRAFWPVLLLAIGKEFSERTQFLIKIGILVLVVLLFIYSYFYYRNFLFHIDFTKKKFILKKGVFSSKLLEIPFDRIQEVNLKRSLLQRFIGVYGVAVDTAGSRKEEIHLPAVSEEIAHALTHILMESPRSEAADHDEEPESKVTPQTTVWSHHLSLGDLIKIGLTQSYFRGFLVIAAFFIGIFQQAEQLLKKYVEQAAHYSESYFQQSSHQVLLVIALLFLIFIVSVLVTVGRVVIQYFNLNIRQTPQRMEVEMGLKTNTKVSFQPRRVQSFEVVTNPIQKKLNLYEVRIALAGTGDDLKKANTVVPGLSKELVSRIKSFLYVDTSDTVLRTYRPHRRWANRRYLFCILPFAVFWLSEILAFKNLHWLPALVASILLLGGLLTYQYFIFKTVQVEVSSDFLKVKQGLWSQSVRQIERYKIQGITVTQPVWYQKGQLYHVTFHTAGGDFRVRALPSTFLKEVNLMLYNVESSQKAWM